jgi:Cdc6-like AAA superfamily ATPase
MDEAFANKSEIIINGSVLFPDVIEDTTCRKEERQILESLNQLLDGKPSSNYYVYGPSGSGKTAICMHLMRHALEKTKNIVCVYINCWSYCSSLGIYAKIAGELGEPVSRRGRAVDEIFDGIVLLMKKERRPVLLLLDEIDGLVCKGDTQILHNIASAGAQGVRFGIVATSEDLGALAKLGSIKDALGFRRLGVRGHTKEELVGLLRVKAGKGLVQGSYDDAVIDEIAGIGMDHNGNAHIALEVLRSAAINAESKGKRKIDFSDIENSFNFTGGHNAEEGITRDILSDGEMTSTEFYCAFSHQLPRTKRQIRNYLHALEAKGAIVMETVMQGRRPKHTLIRLREG